METLQCHIFPGQDLPQHKEADSVWLPVTGYVFILMQLSNELVESHPFFKAAKEWYSGGRFITHDAVLGLNTTPWQA